jgi:hypothetical protein
VPQGINMGGNSGSREPDPSFTGSGPSGFDPGRKKRRDFMPQEIEAHWWQRYGAAAEIEFNLFPGAKPVRKWAFDYEGAFVKRYHGYNVFWLRGWVRVLGLQVGAGIFRRGEKLVESAA